jgi:hypothetical protein
VRKFINIGWLAPCHFLLLLLLQSLWVCFQKCQHGWIVAGSDQTRAHLSCFW